MKKIRVLSLLTLLGISLALPSAQAESCCDKAKKAKKDCDHKCCIDATKAKKTCEKCNPKTDKTEKK